MTKAYLDAIDDRINELQTEIARLTVARGVIEELVALAPPRKREELKALPQTPKKPRRQRSGVNLAAVARPRVIEFFTKHPGPHAPIDMLEALNVRGDTERKPYYNALTYLKGTGQLMRSEEGFYTLRVESTEKTTDAA